MMSPLSDEHQRGKSVGDPSDSFVDWCFRSRQTGQITIAQFPNLALWIFLGSIVVSWLIPPHSDAAKVVDLVGTLALTWWAIDEVLRGVNPWRRLIGIIGLGFVVARLVAML